MDAYRQKTLFFDKDKHKFYVYRSCQKVCYPKIFIYLLTLIALAMFGVSLRLDSMKFFLFSSFFSLVSIATTCHAIDESMHTGVSLLRMPSYYRQYLSNAQTEVLYNEGYVFDNPNSKYALHITAK